MSPLTLGRAFSFHVPWLPLLPLPLGEKAWVLDSA